MPLPNESGEPREPYGSGPLSGRTRRRDRENEPVSPDSPEQGYERGGYDRGYERGYDRGYERDYDYERQDYRRPGRFREYGLEYHTRFNAAGEPWRDRCRVVLPGEIPLTELHQMELPRLVEQAAAEGVEDPPQRSRLALIEAIMRRRVESQGFQWGGGTFELLRDGFGFLRQPHNSYHASEEDVYVSPSQVRRFSLQPGSIVMGQIRPPKMGEGYPALLRVESVNGLDPVDSPKVHAFESLLPTHPKRRIEFASSKDDVSGRVIDLLAPAGFGQRGLIVSPPRCGKTLLLQSMAKGILENHPEAWVIMLLIDERPEDVTDIQQALEGPRCEVLASTFDLPPISHLRLAELVMAKARRMVEAGVDVVLFLDSMTRLARACNALQGPASRALPGGFDIAALERPKALFGTARQTDQAGSLSIFASVTVDSGSPMDQLIYDEFQGTGNMEVCLGRELAEKRIWPAVEMSRSGTRRDEMLFTPAEYTLLTKLRRHMAGMGDAEAIKWLTGQLGSFADNSAFLASVAKKKWGD